MSSQRALVMGLGSFGGGVAVSRFLVAQGYQVMVTDLRSKEQLTSSIDALSDLPIEYRLGEHVEDDFRSAQLVIKNPAVKPGNAYIDVAIAAGARISSEIALFVENCPATIVGITGSNGKTTTSYMTAYMLGYRPDSSASESSTRSRVFLGGNLGKSLLDELPAMTANDQVVLELSSFQLMDLERVGWSAPYAAITNITPNHLDWHSDMAEYVRAKSAIFRNADNTGFVALNADCAVTASLADKAPGVSRTFGIAKNADAFFRANQAVLKSPSGETPLFDKDDIQIPGQHNLSNALCAATLANALGATPEMIRSGLHAFHGVQHRLEFVTEVKGVRFYNDSIATTPESTIAAIKSFASPTYLLLGGSDKGLDFTELAESIALASHVRKVYTTGDVAKGLADAIHQACRKHPDPERALVVEHTPRFADAVKNAARFATKGSVFLMSPACASFYEYEPGASFRNFEHRGEYFKELVASLK